MSSIYALEPPTQGKVVLHTSIGDIDIELWPQQAPKACRNFVQLCMEGYYDGTIVHRVVKGFMAQGGDPTGTGTGGESIYGAPFKTEAHSRLRFNHRGIAAMASPANTREENGSQFFLTFDACEWLNGKHTIFGKVTGDTIFNLLAMQELEVGADDRPENPPRIVSCDVLLSPFDDIVPREPKPAPAETARKKTKPKKKKNATLLSFAEDDEPAEANAVSIAMASSHDLAHDDPMLMAHAADDDDDGERLPVRAKPKEKSTQRPVPESSLPMVKMATGPAGPAENDDEVELARLREQVKSLKSRAFHVEKRRLEADKDSVLTPLEQRRQAYLKKRTTSRKQREEDTLQKLEAFKSTLQSQAEKAPQPKPAEPVAAAEDGNDDAWMKHSLAFGKRPQDFDPMAVDVHNYEYILTDPLAEQAGKKRRRSPPRA